MSLPTKSRVLYHKVRLGDSFLKETGVKGRPWMLINPGSLQVASGGQVTASEGHARGRDGQYHEGGPFHTAKVENHIGSCDVNCQVTVNGGIIKHAGPGVCPRPGALPLNYESYEDLDFDSLDEAGATAIASVAPTNSASNVATLLGEIKKDGLPSLPGILTWKQRTELARAAGSEFLNYQFGWVPLLSEVKNIGNAARHSRDIVQQYQKDEGNNVRRRFDYPIDETVSTSVVSTQARIGLAHGYPKQLNDSVLATLMSETSSTRRKWFSGSFTYALPSRTDSFRRMLGYGSEADKLFGITITPDVLWELAPWSWAVDWFSNAGDVIHNASAFGAAGLVMQYGYMMSESVDTISYSLKGSGIKNFSGAPSSSYTKRVVKTRRPANPFGFGLTEFDLSPTQLAITAALGLTKLR